MRSNVKPCTRFMPTASFVVAAVIAGASTAHGATFYTVTNISTAVTAAGGTPAASDYGSASLSSDGTQVAGLTTARNPFLYVPATNTATILSTVTAVTVAVNNGGTLVSGNSSATTPNVVFKGGTSTTVATTAIANQNTTATGASFVSLTGINNAGTASGYIQYTNNGGGSSRNEGLTYSTTSSAGRDVGSGFSDQLATQARGNILYTVNDSGVGAGFGAAPGTIAPQVIYTATPNGSGGYTYKDLSSVLAASSPSGLSNATPSYVGINSHGDVAGTYNIGLSAGFLYDVTLNKAFAIQSPTSADTNINGFSYVNGVATVVGVSSARGLADVAIAYTEAGGYQTLASFIGPSAAGYTLTSGLSISDRGDILALGTGPTGVAGEFLFAVPEPTSLAALSLGCLALIRPTRRPSAHASV